jgi:hypothetical protein
MSQSVTLKKIKEIGDHKSQPMSDFKWNIPSIVKGYIIGKVYERK